jgi:uncharacterized protein (DUF2267 family)
MITSHLIMDPIISNMWIHSPDRSGPQVEVRLDRVLGSQREGGGVQPERIMQMKCSAECVQRI